MGKHDRVVRQNSGHLVHECGIKSDKDAFFSSSVELPTCKLKVNRESGSSELGFCSWNAKTGQTEEG